MGTFRVQEHFNKSSDTLKEHTLNVQTLRQEKQAMDDERQSLQQLIMRLEEELGASRKQIDLQQHLGLQDKVQ